MTARWVTIALSKLAEGEPVGSAPWRFGGLSRSMPRRRVVRAAVLGLTGSLLVAIAGPAGPAGSSSNGPTTYEADCTNPLAVGVAAPFVIGLDINAEPDDSAPVGAAFGATGSANFTLVGPVIAGVMQLFPSATIGATVHATVGSTDGTATGSFLYTHTFAPTDTLGRQITGVSWVVGATTLTGAADTFAATDVGRSVAGPTGGGIVNGTAITAVAGDGASATISIPTTAAAGPVSIGTGENMTFFDSAFATGDVFTTNVLPTDDAASIGIVGVTSVTVSAGD